MTEAFRHRIQQMFDGTCATFGLSIGSDLGLFQAMVDMNRPCSSEELARSKGCKERYVREWLSGMACAGIIEYQADTERFYIAPEKQPCLTKFDFAPLDMVPVMGQMHSRLKSCFMLDGPIGMNQMDSPDIGVALDSFRSLTITDLLEETILKDVPKIQENLESGISVADIGCGAGRLALLLAERFPNSSIWGIDLDDNLLGIGTERAKTKNLKNIHFLKADIDKLSENWTNSFDYILACDVIHDLPFPRIALSEIRKCLKDGGLYSMLEPNFHSSLKDNIEHHPIAIPYVMSLYTCLSHSLSVPNGEGWGLCLGKERHTEFLREVGFNDFNVFPRGFDNHFVCQK